MALPMEVRRVVANAQVKDDIGKVALQRGPLMYCAEWPDNDGKVSNLIVPASATFSTDFKPSLLNGVMTLRSTVPAVMIDNSGESLATKTKPLIAIPYYAWAHRGKGEMTLWFPTKVKDVDLITNENLEEIKTK